MRILGVVSSSSREVPNAPTIGTATDVGTSRAYNNGAATVTFTAPTWDGGLPITGYTVTSSPGGFTGTGSASPITVTGLQSGTSYTFTVVATNSRGNSTASAASNSITATTVPQAPTIGTASRTNNTTVSLGFTAGATGGKTISSYTATSSPSISLTTTGTSTPLTVTGTYASGTAYTFTITATNANGTSTASSASNSVTPYPTPSIGTWSTSTAYPQTIFLMQGNGNGSVLFAAGGRVGTTVQSTARYWDGSAWSSSIAMPAARQQGGFGVHSNGSFIYVGGYNAGTKSEAYYLSSTSGSWTTTSSALPVANEQNGVAGYGTSGHMSIGGTSSPNTYYRTSQANAWTTGTSKPNGTDGFASHNSDWTRIYIVSIDGYAIYSTTNGTSFTTETDAPSSTRIYNGSNFTPYSGFMFLFSDRGDNTIDNYVHRYNGSTYTEMTRYPVSSRNGCTWGVQGTSISGVANYQDGAASSTHYTATLS